MRQGRGDFVWPRWLGPSRPGRAAIHVARSIRGVAAPDRGVLVECVEVMFALAGGADSPLETGPPDTQRAVARMPLSVMPDFSAGRNGDHAHGVAPLRAPASTIGAVSSKAAKRLAGPPEHRQHVLRASNSSSLGF
jgi:hypothetical protein